MDMRRKDREITDTAEILSIVNRGKILHLGLLDGDCPYVVPMHYGFSYSPDDRTFVFFLHSAKEGHKIDLINASKNVFIELETDISPVSGAEVPCQYGSLYSSFMGRGQAAIVEDISEKKRALQLLMQHQTNRDFAFTPQTASSVCVIKVVVEAYTAKARKL